MFVIDKVIPGAMKSFMNKFNSYYKEKNSGPKIPKKGGRSKNNFANDPFLSEFKKMCSKYIVHVDEIQDFSIANPQDFLRTKFDTELMSIREYLVIFLLELMDSFNTLETSSASF